MKIIIIPDVHNRIDVVETILHKEKDFDRVILLGDMFDRKGDGITEIQEVARWVKWRVHDSRFTFLWGNHDIAYAFRNRTLPAGGYSSQKRAAIWEILNESDFREWKFFWMVQGFLLTHAGLHPNFLPPVWTEQDITTNNIKDFLWKESERCLVELNMDFGYHWFFLAGDARVRPPRGIETGGLLWCDARSEFIPVPKLSQVFGHTPQGTWPTIIYGDIGMGRISNESILKTTIENVGWNVALDCHSAFYAVLTDGFLNIKSSF